MRNWLGLSFASTCAAALLLATPVLAQTETHLDLPSQPLADALRSLGNRTRTNILFDPAWVRNLSSVAVSDAANISDALSKMLAGTGLTYRFIDPRTVTLIPADPVTPTSNSPSTSAADEEAGSELDRLDEIIVTAQKRLERLQDVPVPVTALSTEQLAERGQLRIQDYFATVPGLSLSSTGIGDAKLSIRGITTGGSLTNPTVGITVDDVPYGTSTGFASWMSAPDLDPSDLARIEVLRGPQGTLYGASSLGGLLKYVTVDPSTDALKGRVQVDVSGVHNGDGAGYGVRGAVNVPLGETFAIRASGVTRRDAGYIDAPSVGLHGVNEVNIDGGRLSALWKPSEDWSLKLSALLQDIRTDGTADVSLQPGAGDLEQVLTLPGGGYRHQINSYTAALSGVLGAINLVSISGYSVDDYHRKPDFSAYRGGPDGISDILYGVEGAQVLGHNETRKITQEVRLSGSLQKRFDWLFGLYYAHDDNPSRDLVIAVDPATQAVVGPMLDDSYPTKFSEHAAFADLTVHFTDRFDLQVGGRYSKNRQVYEETITGPMWQLFGLPDPSINPPVHTQDHAFTYLVTPRFRVSDDLMFYGRIASGYRPGGPNPTCISFDLPCQYGPDKTTNYEVGVKGDVLDRRLALDASVYYIDWQDIQIQVADPESGFIFYTNASRARSQGVELSARLNAFAGTTLAAWVAFNDATLTEDLPPPPFPESTSSAIGVSGDRLPFASRLSGNLSLDRQFPLTGNIIASFGGSLTYVGNRKSDFATVGQPTRLELPSYVVGNVRAGASYESWSVNLFVNNVADKRGVISMPPNSLSTFGAIYIQPRTVGMALVKTFE